ncbi:hypothetical protein NDU88_002758 [Pleurodeles waltl]|uniref:Uncharacterized protein n=1 Tax=Pleurodeles waltl TaxID=8319 RepID=A0AAV7LDD1_PLEWA|nr:hypothetical protein NDU88_002758 [Pleurodeles waltl]
MGRVVRHGTSIGEIVAAEGGGGPDWVPVPRATAGAPLWFPALSAAGMGKSDTKQPKLQFEANKSTSTPLEATGNNCAQPTQGENSEMGVMKAPLLTMQSSLSSIDSKMDNMITRLDLLTNKLEDLYA